MFGHFASSHALATRCCVTVSRTASKPRPAAMGARSHCGLRPTALGAAAAVALMPSLIAEKPCGVRYLSPLRAGAEGTMGIPLKSLTGTQMGADWPPFYPGAADALT